MHSAFAIYGMGLVRALARELALALIDGFATP